MFRMHGVVPPMITPFKENGEVDYPALKTLVTFLKDEVDGLFVNGSYGSGVMMTEEERKKVLEETIKTADGKVSIVAHVGTADSLSAARLAQHAADCGVQAVSAVGPFYFKHAQNDICGFYDAIVKAVNGKCGIYVYNNPKFQGYEMSLDLIKKLKKDIGVTGVKDATFDILAHANYMRLLKDENFDIALGTEAMWLSACTLGCEAFIPGLGNVFPEICRTMFKQGISGDMAACRETQFKVNELRDIMYLARSTQLAIYAMLEVRGIVKCCPRAPFIPAAEAEKAAIKERLKALKML